MHLIQDPSTSVQLLDRRRLGTKTIGEKKASLMYHITKRHYIYLNAKVLQLLLKSCFLLYDQNIVLRDIVIDKSNDLPSKQHENQTSETYDCRSLTRKVRQSKFEKSQSYNTLHFIKSQCCNTLHFIQKKVFNHYLLSKAEGQTNQSRLFYAFVNVNYVNVKPSIFDVIGRLSTTGHH